MIASKDLKKIKDGLLKQNDYLCYIALELNIEHKFQDYLMRNLDDTMSYLGLDKHMARWSLDNQESRINWLDNHIEILQIQELKCNVR